MSQEPVKPSPFVELQKTRPLLQQRVDQYQDDHCLIMAGIIDQLQMLERQLQRDAGIQDYCDARLNAMAYREAAEALAKADETLALAARRMSFHA